MRKKRRFSAAVAALALCLVSTSVVGTEALDFVNRDTLVGTWQGLAKEYQIAIRLLVPAAGVPALAIAAVDDRNVQIFKIDKIHSDDKGSLELSGKSSANLLVTANVRGRAAAKVGIVHCAVTIANHKIITDRFEFDMVKSDDLFMSVADASRRAADALRKM
jgi:hypothetical protein